MTAKKKPDPRLAALRRFALTITAFNILGHFYLGFEQAWAHPLVALATGYSLTLLLEFVDSRLQNRRPCYAGGFVCLVNSLLSIHIGALAISMLLYPNERLMPIVFAVAAAVGSKYVFRVPVRGRSCHMFNPSNFGISLTLVLFPWVGISPPYMFTENLYGWGDWLLPGFIVILGSALNAQFTRRMPLILAWMGGFGLQAVVRSYIFGTSTASALLPMTGVAFLLFTFYMITDPGTSPFRPRNQVFFGLATAAAYGVLVSFHIVFGLFFSLTMICGLRGLSLHLLAAYRQRGWAEVPVPSSETASQSLGRSGI